MSAEIVQYKVADAEFGGLRAEVLEDEEEFFYVENFGDGSGNETFIKLEEQNVIIFYGVVRPNAEASEGQAEFSVTDVKHIATIEPGESHVEPLTSPEDDTSFLHVKNIGSYATNHALN